MKNNKITMNKLKLTTERAIIENVDDDGFCYIARYEEGGKAWIEIHGNMSTEQITDDYPLCLESEEEIDEFTEYLKTILIVNEK